MTKLTATEIVFGLKSSVDPQLSPDGEWVVYGVASVNGETKKREAHLWVSRRDGSERRQLTYAGKSNGAARWSPDGRSIAFVSDRDGEAALFLLAFDGGDPRKLATHRNGIGGIEWAPDGARLAYSVIVDPALPDDQEPEKDAPAPIRATSRIDYKQDTRGYLGDKRGQIFLYDLRSNEERRLTHDTDDHFQPRWSPDGTTLAVLRVTSNGIISALEAIEPASGAGRELIPGTGMIGTWSWSPDGAHLLVSADLDHSFQQQLYLLDAKTGALDRLTADLQPSPSFSWGASPATHPVWLDDRRALYAMVYRARAALYVVDTETGDVEAAASRDAAAGGFSVDASGRYVAQTVSSLDETGEVTIHDRETGETIRITELNSDFLADNPPAQWERFEIERGGYTTEAWLLKPAGYDPAKRYPLVLDIHGGPNGWYSSSYNGLQQLLASHGFIVVYSNPRGSGSYGGDFTRQVVGDWGGEDYLDLMAVVDAAIARPDVDPERIGVYGYSYGGYMTSWIIGHTDRFKVAVIGAPAVDLVSMFGTSDLSHAWGPHHWGGTPWESLERYLERSPIMHLHKATTPSLILHAEGDIRCPIGQGEMAFATLKKVGVEAEFVRYPGGDHLFVWSGEPAYSVDFHERILAWYTRYLGSAEA